MSQYISETFLTSPDSKDLLAGIFVKFKTSFFTVIVEKLISHFRHANTEFFIEREATNFFTFPAKLTKTKLKGYYFFYISTKNFFLKLFSRYL